ncbi:MAG: hypothetical protein J5710_07050 [Treponema sp.]|nr:hypothetical protein [Treponema sp.]
MEKQRNKSKRSIGRRLLILIVLFTTFPVFSQTLTSAMLRELRISPVQNQQFWVNTDIKFETVIPFTLPSQIDVSMPEEEEHVIFKTLRKVESDGGTKIEIWFQFDKTGNYTLKPLVVKIKNSRRQLFFEAVTIGINPKEQQPLCIIVTAQGNNKNLTVRAGEKLKFSVCLQYAVQLTQFNWDIPKDSLFEQTKTYEFVEIKQREKVVSDNLIPVSDFEWTPLVSGTTTFPRFVIQAVSYNGDKVMVRMPQITVKVLEGRQKGITEGTSYFEDAFSIDELIEEGNQTAEITVETAKLLAELRGKERYSVSGKARKLRIILEREYNLPYSQKEFKVVWLYICLVLLAAVVALMIICAKKKKRGLNMLFAVVLVLILVLTIYCGVCAGKSYGISTGTKVYSIPESNAAISSELPAGNRVQIVSQTENWYLLKFGEIEGWCKKEDIAVISK